ncbi:MAG: SH3 domain-containing protein [Defluviitaleaceae bacterium]|nr:SH3 domain-containing protein [Defluviitaleaceae bacterium]
MNFFTTTFDRAGDLYGRWFADWLHVHFIIRTVLILFILWMIIFLAAQMIQYVIAPIVLIIFYHIFFRAWNYIFVETPHEWIYIRYHSKDKPNFSALYLRLCDKVKNNRLILSHTKFKGMILRSRKFAMHLMFICAVAVTLWVSAFGLHYEYAVPVTLEIKEREVFSEPEEPENEPADFSTEELENLYHEETPYYTADFQLTPADWQDNDVFTLNEQGRQGARLRDGPGIAGQTVIEILWDDAELIYLNDYVPDEFVNGLYWLRVESPSGTVGYISSQLIEG